MILLDVVHLPTIRKRLSEHIAQCPREFLIVIVANHDDCRSSGYQAAILLIALFFAAAAIGYWVGQGRPVTVGEAAADRVQCLSYAPFRKRAVRPFIAGTMVGEARLREDLQLLAALTGCAPTPVQQGLEVVPRIAQSLGMKVLLGVWLGRDRIENEAELTKAIALARQYPGTIDALVVGNEVLLRRELAEPVPARLPGPGSCRFGRAGHLRRRLGILERAPDAGKTRVVRDGPHPAVWGRPSGRH